MRQRAAGCVAATLSLVICGGVQAQEEADAAGRELLDKATEAVNAVQKISYTAQLTTETSTRRRITLGTVVVNRLGAEDPIGGRIAVEGVQWVEGSDKRRAFNVRYDGEHVRALDAKLARVWEADPDEDGRALFVRVASSILIDDFYLPGPLSDEHGAPTVELAGTAEVEGVPCDVVSVDYSKEGSSAQWYFRTEDHLPVRVTREYLSSTGNPVTADLMLQDINVGESAKSAVFAMEAPPNFEVVNYSPSPPPPVRIGDAAPEWTLSDINGVDRSLSDYRGKIVILMFWASWCPNCKESMPAMGRIQDVYGSQGVHVLAVNCRESPDVDPRAYARNARLPVTTLFGKGVEVKYRVRPIPTFFVIDQEGIVQAKYEGFEPFEDITERNLTRAVEILLRDG